MKQLRKFLLFFIIGGVGYSIIELLWRGRTHPTMFTLGGICFAFFGYISKIKSICMLYKSVICCLFITAWELIYGVIFNIVLKLQVWDYSKMPLNYKGQICLLYSVFWWFLSLLFIPLAEKINNRLQKIK